LKADSSVSSRLRFAKMILRGDSSLAESPQSIHLYWLSTVLWAANSI
jgi:hypothetical protein